MACRADWSEELANDLVQTMCADREVLGRKISRLIGLGEPSRQTQMQFPLHRGAEAYFRRNETGFLAENAESIGALITVALLLANGMNGTKKRIDQRRNNRIDAYYNRVQRILDSIGHQGVSNFGTALLDLDEIESITR